jgi:hypothetical protein
VWRSIGTVTHLANWTPVRNTNKTRLGPLPRLSIGGNRAPKYKFLEVSTNLYRADIQLTQRHVVEANHDNVSSATQQYSAETIARIKAFFKHGYHQYILTGQICRLQSPMTFSSPIPSLSIGKTLPKDSPVFEIIKTGDVQALQAMLSRREVTLRDRGVLGTSFLLVS